MSKQLIYTSVAAVLVLLLVAIWTFVENRDEEPEALPPVMPTVVPVATPSPFAGGAFFTMMPDVAVA